MGAVANLTIRRGFCSFLEKMLWIRIWRIFSCDVTELATALKCQKQLLMSSISNLGGRESLEIAVSRAIFVILNEIFEQQNDSVQSLLNLILC